MLMNLGMLPACEDCSPFTYPSLSVQPGHLEPPDTPLAITLVLSGHTHTHTHTPWRRALCPVSSPNLTDASRSNSSIKPVSIISCPFLSPLLYTLWDLMRPHATIFSHWSQPATRGLYSFSSSPITITLAVQKNIHLLSHSSVAQNSGHSTQLGPLLNSHLVEARLGSNPETPGQILPLNPFRLLVEFGSLPL